MKKIGVANSLTLFRVICIPVFVLFYVLHEYGLALIVYCLGALTDMVDGTVARLLKERSQFGAVLDPIADKLCMLTVFVALAISGVVPWWFIFIILVRDLVVTAGFVFVKVRQIPFRYRAIVTSKIATLAETIAGALAMTYLAFPYSTIWVYPVGDLVYGSILIASVWILIATMQYLKLGLKLLESKFET